MRTDENMLRRLMCGAHHRATARGSQYSGDDV
jgi:hypothetical protein